MGPALPTCQCVVANETAHNDGVCSIVELLGHVAHEERDRKLHNSSPRLAFRLSLVQAML